MIRADEHLNDCFELLSLSLNAEFPRNSLGKLLGSSASGLARAYSGFQKSKSVTAESGISSVLAYMQDQPATLLPPRSACQDAGP